PVTRSPPCPYTTLFRSVLGCQDRVIFKGHLPFSDEAHLNRFVDHTLRIKRKDFLDFAKAKADLLVTSAKDLAARHNAPYLYLQGDRKSTRLNSSHVAIS